MCDKWILKFDHHWFYIGNWVGFNNHKYFILFIFYAVVGCIFESSCFIYSFTQGWFGSITSGIFPLINSLIQISIVMTTSSLSILLLLTIVMMIKNTSVSEVRAFHEVVCSNSIFSIGAIGNIKMVMGDNPWKWLIPDSKIDRKLNGIDFPLWYH